MTSIVVLQLLLFLIYPRTTHSFATRTLSKNRSKSDIKMGWSETWSDILDGGSKRWKVDDIEAKQAALSHINDAVSSSDKPLRILCPLAGDDPFVHHAWSQGHDVTALILCL